MTIFEDNGGTEKEYTKNRRRKARRRPPSRRKYAPVFLKPFQSLNRNDFFTPVIAIGGWSTLARFVVVKDMVERIRKLIRFEVFV